jgi:hypothetical protein
MSREYMKKCPLKFTVDLNVESQWCDGSGCMWYDVHSQQCCVYKLYTELRLGLPGIAKSRIG